MNHSHGRYGRSAGGVVAMVAVVMMVTVCFSAVLSDESSAAAPDYNRYYYDKLDLYDGAEFMRDVYDKMLMITGPEANHTISMSIGGYGIERCQDLACLARTVFIQDHPEYFWLNIYNTDPEQVGDTYRITFLPAEYTSGVSIDTEADKLNAIEEIDRTIEGWGISDTDSDIVKVEKINKGITGLLNKGPSGTDGMAYRNMATAFLSDEHKVVCAGYASSFKYCCDKYNVPCIYVSGQCGGNHAWNNVMIDGKWYMVDPMYNEGTDITDHLLLGSIKSVDHVPSLNILEFPDPVGLFPELSEKGYYQYTIVFKDYDGTVLDTRVYERGDKVEFPRTPSRDGYKFDYWGGKDTEPYLATKDMTFTAVYQGDNGDKGDSSSGCNLVIAGIVLAALSVMAVPLMRYIRP
ncbi:MAG: InlB B-repeat-containing protein [archaeon]|nr:InlB B-repeat-containing protein [archaeon]